MRGELGLGRRIFMSASSAEAADNWRSTPGRPSPPTPDPLPFKPAQFTTDTHRVCVSELLCSARECTCACPPPVSMWAVSVCFRPLLCGVCESRRSFSCAIKDSGLTDDLSRLKKSMFFWKASFFFSNLTFAWAKKTHQKFSFSV